MTVPIPEESSSHLPCLLGMDESLVTLTTLPFFLLGKGSFSFRASNVSSFSVPVETRQSTEAKRNICSPPCEQQLVHLA